MTRRAEGVPTAAFGGDGRCVLLPQEGAGPFALDLSDEEQFLRAEVAEGRPGIPLTLVLSLVDVEEDCAPIPGARVDVWHCDAGGAYSGFRQPGGVDTTGETFCRGIQPSDENGQVTFQTIYPGWYPGRITHVHLQIFFASGLAATSQLGFPQEVTAAAYRVAPYAARGPNTSVTSFDQDAVFRDGTRYQLASVTGSADTRYIASLVVGVAGGQG